MLIAVVDERGRAARLRAGTPVRRRRSRTPSARPCRCSRSRSSAAAASPRASAPATSNRLRIALGVVIGAGRARARRSTSTRSCRPGSRTTRRAPGQSSAARRTDELRRAQAPAASACHGLAPGGLGPTTAPPRLHRHLGLDQLEAADARSSCAARSCWSTSGRTRASTACARSRTSRPGTRRYRKNGLVIVGVHTPEFAFEHVPSNVREAVARARRSATRSRSTTTTARGTAYHNQYWPAEYLIDKRGHVREVKKGEGQLRRHRADDPRRCSASRRTCSLASVAGQARRATCDRRPSRTSAGCGSTATSAAARRRTCSREYRFPRSMPPTSLAYCGPLEGRAGADRRRQGREAAAALSPRRTSTSSSAATGGCGVFVDGHHEKTIQVNGLSRLYTVLRFRRTRSTARSSCASRPGSRRTRSPSARGRELRVA